MTIPKLILTGLAVMIAALVVLAAITATYNSSRLALAAICAGLAFVTGVGCARKYARGEWTQQKIVRLAVPSIVANSILVAVMLTVSSGTWGGPHPRHLAPAAIGFVLITLVAGFALGFNQATVDNSLRIHRGAQGQRNGRPNRAQ